MRLRLKKDKIQLLRILKNPFLLWIRIKGMHPFYYLNILTAKKFGGNLKTIIDVGANVGDYSRVCNYVFPKARPLMNID